MLVVTHAVTGVGGMIKETQNTIIITHQTIQLQRASRHLSTSQHILVQSADNYLVQNQIIASRWMHINDIYVKYLG